MSMKKQCKVLKHVKSLEVITLILTIRKKLKKLKISDFSWTHQQLQGKHCPESWINKWIQAVIDKICLPEAETVEAIDWRDYFK